VARSIYRSANSREELFARYDRMLEEWPVPFRSSFVQTSFGATHVISSGPERASPVLLLHPSRSNSVLWMRNVAEISKALRVIAVDIVGDAGKSEPDDELPFGFDRPWLLQILDSLFIDRVDVVAISRASQMAVNLASYVPNRVGRLVLVSASLNGSAPSAEMRRRRMRARLVPSADNIRSVLSLLAPTLAGSDAMLDFQGAVFRTVREPSYRMYEPERFGSSPPFAPTLLLLGEREAEFDLVAATSLGKRVFPNITVEVLPEVGHLMNIERPDLVDSRILRFLGG
jgi:pimeloyl-ACP methyl ester carboxylesterase